MSNSKSFLYRDHLPYWQDDQEIQNFGDYLTEYLMGALFLRTPRLPGDIRIIGSYLDDYHVKMATDRPKLDAISGSAALIAWSGGVRQPGGISPEWLKNVDVLSVRGPLSREQIGGSAAVPLGDPGLLLPALYSPVSRPELTGQSICVPHFNDPRDDDTILAATGADRILRASIGRSARDVETFIDKLTSADFALCGSLHAAIVAAAYGTPFGYWDSGDIDIPFKWQDFSKLVGIDCVFHLDVDSARQHYLEKTKDAILIPDMWGALAAPPYPLRAEAILQILRHDLRTHRKGAAERITEIIDLLRSGRRHQEKIVSDATQLVDALQRRCENAMEALAAAELRVEEAKALSAGHRAAMAVAEQRAADAETAPLRHVQGLVEAGDRLAEELRRANARPWRPLKRALQRGGLRLALAFGPLLPERRRGRLRRSLEKRLPSAHAREWDRVVSGVLAETGHSLPQRTFPVDIRRSSFAYRALNVLADLSEPLSKRRASRFRRSAAKRAPDNFRLISTPLHIEDDGRPAVPVADPLRARRVLVADSRLPRQDTSAGERATVGLVADLVAAGFEVVFLPHNMGDDATYRQHLEDLGAEVVTNTEGYPYAAAYIQEQGHRFGLFYLIRVEVAEALLPSARAAAPDARVVFHAPDLHFLREMRAAELGGDAGEMSRAHETREREFAIMRASDHVVLVSPAERPYLEEAIAPDRITVFPALYSPVADDPPGHGARRNLFFLGGFGHSANPPAVRWFVEKVWPTVHAALPEAEFHIIGAEAPPDIVALGERPGVRFVGYVADLDPVLAGYRLSVVPLLFGAGIKGKLGMALGAGVATVTTSIGAEGMGIEDGVHAFVRDDPEGFADAVIALYEDEAAWTRLSRNGRKLVAETFGDLANKAAFLRAIEAAGALPLDIHIGFCQRSAPLALPDPDPALPIDVSIIVPVHNQWHLTQACLNSVAIGCIATGLRCEVILADDRSTDETLRAAEAFPGLRVVRHEVNLGVLRNCNAAAATARGRTLLFLNNDTVVMPLWLTALMRTLRENPDAAFVGSKLVFPDGHIQQAGGVLFADGSATDLGSGEPSYALAHSQDREVDFVDFSALLVHREVWEASGALDPGLPPDATGPELCLAARAMGRSTRVSGRSVVVAQASRAGRRKRTRVTGRWTDYLATAQLPPGTPAAIAAAHAERTVPARAIDRRRAGKLNVLYFTPFPSHPDNHGNQATIQSFGRRFKKLGHKVHFVLLESTIYDDAAVRAMRAAWDTFDILPNGRPLWSDGSEIPFDHWYQPGLGEQIAQLCRLYEIDVVFCSYVFQSKLLDFVPAHVLKVIDTHDKMGNRHEMLRQKGQPVEFFSCTPEEEGRYLRRADVVVARRAEEAAYFDSVTGRQSAIVIPHVEEARFVDRDFGPVRTVGMVASANRINLAITADLLKALAARERNGGLPFSLHIAGQVSDMIRDLPREDASLFSRPWVKLLGFVPDIGRFYGSVDLVVSPVTMGTGINVKTVQAMAFGMPLVTTAWGSKGIETGHPMHGHADVEELVDGLFQIAADAAAINDLARVSRERYTSFLAKSDATIEDLFGRVRVEA